LSDFFLKDWVNIPSVESAIGLEDWKSIQAYPAPETTKPLAPTMMLLPSVQPPHDDAGRELLPPIRRRRPIPTGSRAPSTACRRRGPTSGERRRARPNGLAGPEREIAGGRRKALFPALRISAGWLTKSM